MEVMLVIMMIKTVKDDDGYVTDDDSVNGHAYGKMTNDYGYNNGEANTFLMMNFIMDNVDNDFDHVISIKGNF